MFYFFIFIQIYLLFYSHVILCLGSYLFVFVIFLVLVNLSIHHAKVYSNTLLQVEVIMFASFVIWLKLYNLINLFEHLIFSKIFSNIFSLEYNFVNKNYVENNKDLYLLNNQSNVYEQSNTYKNLISNISCFH